MTVLLYTLGVLVFALAILASIGLHELGHMIPAKAFGGKVTQYFIGFGPTVWSKQVGETEYGIKAVPLGGYVKIVGMLPPGADHLADSVEMDSAGNQVIKVRKSNTGMFTQAHLRRARGRVGDHHPRRLRAAVLPDAVVEEGHRHGRRPDGEHPDRLRHLRRCLRDLRQRRGPGHRDHRRRGLGLCEAQQRDGRGVHPRGGSRSSPPRRTRRASRRATGWSPSTASRSPGWKQMQDLVRKNGTAQATVVVERDGEQRTFQTTTVVRPPAKAGGATDAKVGFLGVTPRSHPTTGGVGYTLGQMGTMTVDVVKALGTLPTKVWGVAQAIVGVKERDPMGPVSIVGGGRLAGETASHEEIPVKQKMISLLMLVAGFNFFIGMFNFVPLLPLDGGHIAGALWEALRRGWARLRRRPDPGYVDVAKLLPVAYVVGLAILVMGVVLIVGDLVVPVHLES
ncbi:site-2 protease family protein [Nocardioides convexus]|uniref:site-2 protease family protein n=1 Tax=Nocardioides convexus TaxID=2712224 RepID=UPI00241827A6|nr:site-2 protease family protein [Nocardioides convexus]